MSPRISIGLPVYNGERYLETALDSLLRQTCTDFELIISDNASSDGTEAICRRYAHRDPRVLYHRSERNRGASWNHNHVVEFARAPYFKWAAHDDVCAPEFLERCAGVLDGHPAVILCYPQTLPSTNPDSALARAPIAVPPRRPTRSCASEKRWKHWFCRTRCMASSARRSSGRHLSSALIRPRTSSS